MNKQRFYRCQLDGMIFYILLLWFFGIMTVAAFVAPAIIFYIEQIVWQQPLILEEIILFVFLFLFFTAFFFCFFLYFKIKIGGRRKRSFNKFKQLSYTEQAKINSELSGKFGMKFGHVYLGEERLYIRSAWCVEFFDYKDVAWVYRCNTSIPMLMGDDNMIEVAHINAKSLHIYDIEGTRYKIQTSGYTDANAEVIIELLKYHTPNVIIGYSKERQKRAKKDFRTFISEEREAALKMNIDDFFPSDLNINDLLR